MAESTTLSASGTQTSTVTTEHVLNAPNTNGVFELVVDTNAMVAGDVLELRVYAIVLTGGTSRVCYIARYAGAQNVDDLIKRSPLIGNDLTDSNSLKFTLKQTFGTSRAYPWKLLQY